MKEKFPAYYRIHKEDLLGRFDDCVFVLDACTMLDVFRLKKELTEEVFNVFDHLKAQIVIPYHAAEEYNKNIHEVLNTQLQKIESAEKDFNAFFSSLQGKRSQPYISKESETLMGRLKKQMLKDFKAEKDYLTEQLLHGEYQNKMADMLNGCVMEPFTAEEIKTIEEEGVKRYEDKIPPGWKDASKGENRYGDLINWKEMLRYAKQTHKSLVLVSSDMKDDWVIKERGMVICPQYELLREFYQEVGNVNQLFHILSLDRFLEMAHERDEQVVSEAAVVGVKDYLEGLNEYEMIRMPYDMRINGKVGSQVVFDDPELNRQFQEMKQSLVKVTYNPAIDDDWLKAVGSVEPSKPVAKKLRLSDVPPMAEESKDAEKAKEESEAKKEKEQSDKKEE